MGNIKELKGWAFSHVGLEDFQEGSIGGFRQPWDMVSLYEDRYWISPEINWSSLLAADNFHRHSSIPILTFLLIHGNIIVIFK